MTQSERLLFTAIIPVYNGEKYLAAAIQSVLDLGDEVTELIVVDDGSTDATAEVTAGFAGRVRYVFQSHRGAPAARNCGLRLACGEIIGFLDADDLWTPNIATRAFTLLIGRPDVDIVQGRIQEIRTRPSDAPGIPCEYLSRPYSYINLGSAVYRRRVFERVGIFDETMPLCDDYDWFLRAFDARIPKMRIDDVTILWRIHSSSMTHGKGPHGIGMAKAHKKAIQRRRCDPMMKSKPPSDFPTIVEYIGTKPKVT